jgi:hypothetical protein
MSEEDFQANRHTYMLDGEKMVKIWSTFVIWQKEWKWIMAGRTL